MGRPKKYKTEAEAKAAAAAAASRWRAAHPDYMRQWREAHIRPRNPKNPNRLRWGEQHPDKSRDFTRRWHARKGGHLPPPPESECPPRPADGLCQGCGKLPAPLKSGEPDILMMDHDHVTGAFRGWVCAKCNSAPERRHPDKQARKMVTPRWLLGYLSMTPGAIASRKRRAK